MDRQLQDEILNTARRLFIVHGYHGLSMRTIAERIGVSKAALYYHFEDKQALFLAILRKSLQEMEVQLDRCVQAGSTAEERIELFVRDILQQPPENRAVIRLASQELGQLGDRSRQAFETEYQKHFLDKLDCVFEDGIANGEFRQLEPRLLTWALLGLLYPYYYPPHDATTVTVPPLEKQITTIFFDGIRGPS